MLTLIQKWISSLIPEEDNVNEALLRSKVSAMNLKVRANLPSNYLMRYSSSTKYFIKLSEVNCYF